MHEECRRCHLADPLQVVESFLNQVFQVVACLIFDNIADRFESRHQNESTWFPLAADVGGWTTTDAPPKNDNIFLIDANDFVYVIINVKCVFKHIFFICFERFLANITWIVQFRKPRLFLPSFLSVIILCVRAEL